MHCRGHEEDEVIVDRIPISMIHIVRKRIASRKAFMGTDLDARIEMTLYNCTCKYLDAFFGLRQLVTTKFPFPLVQMTKTFLYFWVFTLPFCLVHDMNTSIWSVTTSIFFITYGYVGLEFVSNAMDHPFGDAPNDFDLEEMKVSTLEVIYSIIRDTSGAEGVKELNKLEAL